MVFNVCPCLPVFVYYLYVFISKHKFVLVILNMVRYKNAFNDEFQCFLLCIISYVSISKHQFVLYNVMRDKFLILNTVQGKNASEDEYSRLTRS